MLYKTLLILVLYTNVHDVQPRKLKKDHSWDVLTFTQQWPVTVCDELKNKNSMRACRLPKQPNLWSIHGVWPSKYNARAPFYCNNSAHFDSKVTMPIEDELLEHWSSIHADRPQHSFWAHEWKKHGTCATQLKEFDTILKYFSKGLELYYKYNLTSILSDANIVPSTYRAYGVDEIVKAIRVRLGVNPVVKCRELKRKTKLIDIRLCFSKALVLVHCDEVGDSILSNCDRTQGILYLPFNVKQATWQ